MSERVIMKGSDVISIGQAYPLLEVANMTPSQEEYRTIPLTQGQVALVDAADYDRLSAFKWSARWNRCTRTYYAVSHYPRNRGAQKTVLMHRLVLGLKHKDGKHCDHVNGDTLDNRRFNIRACQPWQNCCNVQQPPIRKSGLKGAYRQRNRWLSIITCQKRRVYLGYFDSPEDAHQAYCAAAVQLHGKFARFE